MDRDIEEIFNEAEAFLGREGLDAEQKENGIMTKANRTDTKTTRENSKINAMQEEGVDAQSSRVDLYKRRKQDDGAKSRRLRSCPVDGQC